MLTGVQELPASEKKLDHDMVIITSVGILTFSTFILTASLYKDPKTSKKLSIEF